jgi:Transposase DDE domain
VDRMRRKLQNRVGAAIYATRKTVVESAFGQIKQAPGFRLFLLRGQKRRVRRDESSGMHLHAAH